MKTKRSRVANSEKSSKPWRFNLRHDRPGGLWGRKCQQKPRIAEATTLTRSASKGFPRSRFGLVCTAIRKRHLEDRPLRTLAAMGRVSTCVAIQHTLLRPGLESMSRAAPSRTRSANDGTVPLTGRYWPVGALIGKFSATAGGRKQGSTNPGL
jgi:hypothetical protein